MAYTAMKSWLDTELDEIRAAGLFKDEQVIETPQGARVTTDAGARINFCANNYLGLADNPEILEAVTAGSRSEDPRLRDGVRSLHLRNTGHPQRA
mgnify:CR=1 FL=1